jgi:predicted RNA binding protein YcfA (HicA-like mRNA interferase family)
MPKLAPVDWGTLEKIFLLDGWTLKREKGSHRAYTKPGYIRPVVIPKYSEVGIDIISANLRTAKLSREEYFSLLKRAK